MGALPAWVGGSRCGGVRHPPSRLEAKLQALSHLLGACPPLGAPSGSPWL